MSATKTKKPTYYQQIHSAQRSLTICKGVHRTVKAVISYYLSRTNHRHQLAWPTQTTIANDLGISLKTICRAFAAAMEVQALEAVFHSIQEARQSEVPVRAQHDQKINFVRPVLTWEGFTQRAIPDDQAELILRHVQGLMESENNGHQQGLGGAYPRDAGRSAPPPEVRLPGIVPKRKIPA